MSNPAAQFIPKTRLAVHKNCVKRIESAQGYITEIKKLAELNKDGQLSPKDRDDINYLERRIKELKLSILIVYNTQRLLEMRQSLVQGWKAQLADPTSAAGLTPVQRSMRQNQINEITRALNCKDPRCGGKGWTGIKTQAGEFELCKCTIRTIDYYVTVDAPEAPPEEEAEAVKQE